MEDRAGVKLFICPSKIYVYIKNVHIYVYMYILYMYVYVYIYVYILYILKKLMWIIPTQKIINVP